ncbi:P-type conjugative transfer protein TrbG [Roseibium algicola]|uniref:P-type conjugative transfer protein TrbG n=2 Tax=Roseibium algicola TaxID=2857014 RepID=A0ABM6IAN1_9HYPH|nr:P-type conjugative transfer protein TrbG [Roseibium aggregatum]
MKRLIFLCVSVSLGACTQKQLPPEIDFDAATFDQASLTVDPPGPVTIVEKPKLLPLPGQMKKAPGIVRKTKDERTPEERIASANEAAKIEPTGGGYINAIQIYPYVEGALYQLYTAPEQLSDIALQTGEAIVAVSAGDTVRWVIGDTVSGTGDKARAHVLVKPIKEGLKTNLVIITDRRTYHLELTSDTETYMASVSWHYPRDELLALQRRNVQAHSAAEIVADRGLRLDQLKFRYRLSGDTPSWRPVRVFDDTHKVYIQFPERLDQGEAPPLFVVGPNGENQLVNYRVNGSYYIVDRLFAAAELRLGTKPQQVVRITRSDGRPAGRRSLFGFLAGDKRGAR